jgi:hypothetical protein
MMMSSPKPVAFALTGEYGFSDRPVFVKLVAFA